MFHWYSSEKRDLLNYGFISFKSWTIKVDDVQKRIGQLPLRKCIIFETRVIYPISIILIGFYIKARIIPLVSSNYQHFLFGRYTQRETMHSEK